MSVTGSVRQLRRCPCCRQHQDRKEPGSGDRANAICERVIGTLRGECPERMLILARRHMETVLASTSSTTTPTVTIDLSQRAPSALRTALSVISDFDCAKLRITTVRGGLIHEYRMVA
jgi:putative transposase